jgi:hypothetical protein
MTSIRTEYAVRYTGRQYGEPAVIVDEVLRSGDRKAAEPILQSALNLQDKLGSDRDAVIVSRTVTVSDWTEA